jgi:hypothetical protein
MQKSSKCMVATVTNLALVAICLEAGFGSEARKGIVDWVKEECPLVAG